MQICSNSTEPLTFQSASLTVLTLRALPSYLEEFSLISILFFFLSITEVSHPPTPSFGLSALSLWSQSQPHLHTFHMSPVILCLHLHAQSMGSSVAQKLSHCILCHQYLAEVSVNYQCLVNICGMNVWKKDAKVPRSRTWNYRVDHKIESTNCQTHVTTYGPGPTVACS